MALKAPKKQAKQKKLVKVDPSDLVAPVVEPAEEVATELDPEILEAITSKKAKKSKTSADVDYIPELERDTGDFDFGDDI